MCWRPKILLAMLVASVGLKFRHLRFATAFSPRGRLQILDQVATGLTPPATIRLRHLRAAAKTVDGSMKQQSLVLHGPEGFSSASATSRPFKLVIVESPSKCHTISKILQDYVKANQLEHDYVVTSCMGHIRNLPRQKTSKDQTIAGIELKEGYKPIYVLLPQKERLVSELRDLSQRAQQVILATDDDREGEAMAWHLLQVLLDGPKDPQMPPLRVRFSEITPKAIVQSIDNPATTLRENLVQAQETRRVLDRLAGYTVSPLLWKKIAPGLSAGRVQSVGMALIVQRERERLLFKSTDYWDLDATFSVSSLAGNSGLDTVMFPGKLVSINGTRLASGGSDFDPRKADALTPSSMNKLHLKEKDAQELQSCVENDGVSWTWTVTNVTSSTRKLNPPPPFTTSTLQQEANKRLGLSVSRTMQAAQQLYENGYITYMRTDSSHLSDDAQDALRHEIVNDFGEENYNPRPAGKQLKSGKAQVKKKKDGNNTDPPPAHEAVRPVIHPQKGFLKPSDEATSQLADVEKQLYRLIYQRTVASHMTPQVANQTSVRILGESNSGTRVIFSATGSVVIEPGFTMVDPKDDTETSKLPPLREGQPVDCETATAVMHTTQPPARYTEASFVRELEALGIGRPSTYAGIVQILRDRAYVGSPSNSNSSRGRGSSKVVSGSAISAQRAAGGVEFTGPQNARGPLVPSLSAFVVCALLENHCPDYVDPSFTARMEDRLDQIANSAFHVSQNERISYLEEFYGGENGLAAQIKRLDESVSADEARRARLPALEEQTPDDQPLDVGLYIGPWGPYVRRQHFSDSQQNSTEAEKPVSASLPPAMATDLSTITREALGVVLATREKNGVVLGEHPEDGRTIRLKLGRFGAYLQWGDDGVEGTSTHTLPRRKNMIKAPQVEDDSNGRLSLHSMLDITLEEAVQYVNLPREVGNLHDLPIMASIGPYGPYLKYNGTFLSLNEKDGDVLTIDFDSASELVTEGIINRKTKLGRGVVAEIGEMEGSMMTVKSGRFGMYLNWKSVNAKVPADYLSNPSEIPIEEAWSLISAKAESAPRKSTVSKKGKGDKTKSSVVLPQAPKRPLSAYLHFCADKRPEVAASAGSLGSISQELARLWAGTSDEARAPYVALADKSKEEYSKMKSEWQAECQKILSSSSGSKSTVGKTKKNTPKRPKSAYLYFCDAKRPLVSQKFSKLGDISKELAMLWSKSGDEERRAYEELATADKKRYEDEVAMGTPGKSLDAGSTSGKATKGAPVKKRGPSAYMLFCAEHRNSVVDENGERLPFGETTKRLAQMWRECNEEERTHFVMEAEKQKDLVAQ